MSKLREAETTYKEAFILIDMNDIEEYENLNFNYGKVNEIFYLTDALNGFIVEEIKYYIDRFRKKVFLLIWSRVKIFKLVKDNIFIKGKTKT